MSISEGIPEKYIGSIDGVLIEIQHRRGRPTWDVLEHALDVTVFIL